MQRPNVPIYSPDPIAEPLAPRTTDTGCSGNCVSAADLCVTDSDVVLLPHSSCLVHRGL